jgi:pyrroloquinoline quinone (PQQ) biosynthesis protein C
MMTPAATFSDLLVEMPDGTLLLNDGVHPMPNLLSMDAEEVLKAFKSSQQRDFSIVIDQLEAPDNPLNRLLNELRAIAEKEPGNRFKDLELFQPNALRTLFIELHEHVMDHPVWRHPFFVRVFKGDFDEAQLALFAKHYFNQIKNTRQCVALALGRFSGVMPLPYGCLNERVSELGQIVLAQLLADEYGVGTHSIEDYPDLHRLLSSTTHIGLYRNVFDGLGIPFEQQDVAMLPGVADNVLTQRLLAGDPRFTLVESLASVGLGMEWGVPEFFSLLLGGMIRWAHKNGKPLTQRHLIVFIAHVQYDVLHAISVMLVTSFFNHERDGVRQIKQATNTLMSARYGMMSDIYRHVFGEPCAGIHDIGLAERYRLSDRRIADALIEARRQIAPERVVNGNEYRQSEKLPFVFS